MTEASTSPTKTFAKTTTMLQKKPPSGQPTRDYKSRGWDYGRNFTLNICGAVVDPVRDVVGVGEKMWQNVSAYYTTSGGDVVSIGSVGFFLARLSCARHNWRK